MPTAQVTGLSSGIDWQETVQLMMQIESMPMVMLEDKKDGYQAELNAWQTINTNLLSLASIMEGMDELDELLVKAASSTDTDVATATADASAAPGSYSLEVNQLAQNHKLIHEGFADNNTTAVHNGPGDGTFTYTYAGDTYNVTVPSGSTLVELVELINDDIDNPGVNATILNDGGDTNPYHLVLSGETGADNVITVTGTTDNFSLNYDISQTAQDAHIKVDGYPVTPDQWITSETNEVTDIIAGVTLTLMSANPGQTINITVTNDLEGAKEKISEFVTAYNEIVSLINYNTKYEPPEESEEEGENEWGTAGPLFGDASAIGIKGDLQAIISSVIPGLEDGALYQSLGAIGVELTSGGLLSIDDSKLTDALEEDYQAVGEVFAFSSSSTNNNLSYFFRTEATQGGIYNIVANYDASGQLTSATINGNTAQIDGNYIIGMAGNPEEGLRIEFTDPGGGAGSISAEVRLSTGAAVQIANRTSFLTDPIDGTVHNAMEGIEDTIENIDKQIQRWERRLETKQEQLEAQFMQMEILIGQLQSQGNYVSAMLSGM
jgi:flagellar hook-associated protein 2